MKRIRFKLWAWASLLSFALPVFSQEVVPAANVLFQQQWTSAQFPAEDLSELKLTHQHTSHTSGWTHLYFQQYHNDIPLRYGVGSAHVDPQGKIKHTTLQFHPNVNQKLRPTATPIAAERAVAIAANITGVRLPIDGSGKRQATTTDAQLVYLPDEQGDLQLSWEVALPESAEHDQWVIWLDAGNGKELERRNRVLHCRFEPAAHNAGTTDHRAAEKSSNTKVPATVDVNGLDSRYYAYPMSTESPAYGQRQELYGADIVDPLASPYGWHDIDGNAATTEFTYTRGNNVYAFYAPTGASNPPASPILRDPLTGLYVSGNVPWPDGNSLDFNYRRNLEQTMASNFVEDAVTNLFVRNNFTHDLLYRYGFDEAAGNFQTTNYTGAGLDNDHVLARAQDGLGINQASFSTPPDGQNPSMRMFLWNTDLPKSARDGSFDNLIIAHEYGHGLSFRLVGGASDVNCLNNFEQGGEGWSDFLGLIMTLEDRNGNGLIEEDVLGEGVRGIGHYVLTREATNSGLRPRHYATDMNCRDGLCNDFTYGDLADLPVPHGVGFLWCTMLWDMTWNLINDYGFEPDLRQSDSPAGNVRALKIVVEALKMTPCNPTFIDMRDAILTANEAIYNGEGADAIWAAFARRGLGYSAGPGGAEAFDDPYMGVVKTVDKTAAGIGETVTYTITVTNHTDERLKHTVISDDLPPRFHIYEISDRGKYENGTVTWNHVHINPGETITRTITGYVAPGAVTTVQADYPVELNNLTGFAPAGAWVTSSDHPNPNTNSQLSWFHLAPNAASEGSLEILLPLDGNRNNYLSFWQAYDVEPTVDGGVLEVWNGKGWSDLGDRIVQNGYNSILLDALPTPVGVPIPFTTLSGRRAFTGYSGGYVRTLVDLSGYGGLVRVRFRFASNAQNVVENCDGSTPGCDGWFLDDFQVLDLKNLLNTACADSREGFAACDDVGVVGTIIYPAASTRSVTEATVTIPHRGIEVFPNPTSGRFTVQFGTDMEDEQPVVQLMRPDGQLLARYNLPAGDRQLLLDATDLPAGVYLLRVQSELGVSVHRVVVE